MKMENICRSCMSESPQMKNVFEIKTTEGSCLQLAEMFTACTSIQIASDDGLPVQLCQTCETKLDTAFEFKKQCEKTDLALRQITAPQVKRTPIVDFVSSRSKTPNDTDSEYSDPSFTEEKNSKQFVSFPCTYCKKVLRTKRGLMFHKRRHTGDQLRSCHLCNAKFTRTNHLNRHLKLHGKTECEKLEDLTIDFDSIKTDECDNGNESDAEVGGDNIDIKDEDYTIKRRIRHSKDKENEEKSKYKENEKEKVVMVCEFCDRKFKYKKSFLHHMQSEHGMSDESELSPIVCSNNTEKQLEKSPTIEEGTALTDPKENFTNSQSSDEEINTTELEDDPIVDTVTQTLHTCHVCSVQFTRANYLTRHMTIHRALLTHKCDKCDKSFVDATHLETHIQEDHINKPYDCNICNTTFSRGEQFIRHLKVHDDGGTEENAHKCSICGNVFSRLQHLVRHTKAHIQKDKRHVCSDCGKAFNRADNLKAHQRIHSELKDTSRLHLCVYCGKDFSSSSNMIVHMRRHTGERPYKCSICNKGFPRSHDLKCHERTHSGEKPYLCTLCGKSFNKSNKLLRHTRVHTGERPYVCNICGRAFTQSNDLALHTRRHTGARPYVCGVCPARFIQSCQLKAHRRSTNHWMDIAPDLKGGHRVEQVTPITNPAPIKFKTHGKLDLKIKDNQIYEDVKEEPPNVIQQVNTISLENEVVIPTPYLLDGAKFLPDASTGGFFVFSSVLNHTIDAAMNHEKLKVEIQNGSVSSVHSDDTIDYTNKVDLNASSITILPKMASPSYTISPAAQYTYNHFG